MKQKVTNRLSVTAQGATWSITAAIIGMIIAMGPVAAQDSTAPTQPGAAAQAEAVAGPLPEAARQTRGIDEIVITAQKRAQNLQEVPIAVTAFGEDELRRTGATSLDQLTEFVAGAELYDERGAGLPVWVIRGVGLTDFNANNTPAAAIYYDEFYLASNAYGGIGLFDVERVEVLKGPQGGLYGRNTTGGAVRIVSARPQIDEQFNGYFKGSYGRWKAETTQLALGGPAGDKMAWRVAINRQSGGGWQDTLATAEDDQWGDADVLAGKVTLVAEPSDNFNIGLKVEAGYNASETTLGYARAVYDLNTTDYCDAAQAGHHDPQNCVTWYNVTKFYTHTPGDAGILPSEIEEDGTTVMSNPHNELDNDWVSFTLDMSLDFDAFTVRAITGFIDYNLRQTFDYDASPLTMGEEVFNLTQLSGWSQEVRLQSADDTGLIWLAGAGYAEDRDEERRIFNALDNRLVLPAVGERGFVQTTAAWTIYGQAEYEVFKRIRLNGSLRYTDETKNLDDAFFRVVDTLAEGTPDLGNQDILGLFLAEALGSEVYENVDLEVSLNSNWSGHIGVDWLINDDVMAYTKLTRGFKSGGFYGEFALTREQLGPYFEENTTALEIGIKSTLFDRSLRINAAAFAYDYRDIQGFNNHYNATNDSIVSVIGNIGDGAFYGGEVETQWVPHFFPKLELTASLSILDAKITSADSPAINADGTEYDRVGKRIPNAAKWSYLIAANYETEIQSWFLLGASMTYSWRDDLYGSDHTSKALDVAVVSQEAYGLLNARLSARDMDGTWEIALSGKNLTNTSHWVSATSNGLGDWLSIPNRPASWAIEVSYNW